MEENTQSSSPASFYPEIEGKCIPEFTVVSGQFLIKMYISAKYQEQLWQWVEDEIDPNAVSPKDLADLKDAWRREAELLYPDKGDYKVRLLDEEGDPVVIGSDVEFIGVGSSEGTPTVCRLYELDLSGVSPAEGITYSYLDCETRESLKFKGIVGDIIETEFCSVKGFFTSSVGTVTDLGECPE